MLRVSPSAFPGLQARGWSISRSRSLRRLTSVRRLPASAPEPPQPVRLFPAKKLHRFCKDVFVACGVPKRDADVAATVLNSADLRGIDSHGIARLPTYVELLQAGRINPRPNITIVRETPTTATVDGDNGLGLVIGPFANRLAMTKAEKYGCGFVAVRSSNHFGVAGFYALEAAQQNLIAMCMTNTTKLVAPFGGAERMLGTNPIAVAIPAGEESPLVMDMSTSAVAYGKVEMAERKGDSMPFGWCIDKTGNPTDDPDAMRDGGSLVGLGSDHAHSGHKGYALSAWVDIMSAVLSGACWGPFVPPFTLRDGHDSVPGHTHRQVGTGVGHFFGAWRVDAFRDPAEFRDQMDDWIRTFRGCKPQPGQEVLIPGDPELECFKLRVVEGVPLTEAVIREVESLAESTNVPWG